MIKTVTLKRGTICEPSETPVDYATFLSKLSARDRLNIDRHLAACEAEPMPDHASLWKRMVCALSALAPHAVQTVGQQAVQFFIADGKYRMQVFAMEDLRNGKLTIYTVDVLDQAMRKGVLTGPLAADGSSSTYGVGKSRQTLTIDSLTASNTPDPPAFYKHMLGWNRKALRISLLTTSTPAQVNAIESLCALAARQWTGA